jgi:hypothetical protein
MEPLTTTASAIAAIVATKALEKNGEKVGELLWNKISHVLDFLKQRSPDKAIAITNIVDQPLAYGQAILDVEAQLVSEANNNPQLKQAIEDLANIKSEDLPNLESILQEIRDARKNQTIEHFGKMADTIHGEKGTTIAQKVVIENQHNTY